MRTVDDRTGLEVLSENKCLLLGRSLVGRLAVATPDGAEVFPLNFRRDGRTIVFGTDEGTKLDVVSSTPLVAFEVDEYDARSRAGWSVIVRGTARDVTASDAPDSLRSLGVQPWALGPKARYVRSNRRRSRADGSSRRRTRRT